MAGLDKLDRRTPEIAEGGMRIEGSWSKAWEGRRGRERSLTMFAGMAAHAVFLSDHGLRGWTRMHPHGADDG